MSLYAPNILALRIKLPLLMIARWPKEHVQEAGQPGNCCKAKGWKSNPCGGKYARIVFVYAMDLNFHQVGKLLVGQRTIEAGIMPPVMVQCFKFTGTQPIKQHAGQCFAAGHLYFPFKFRLLAVVYRYDGMARLQSVIRSDAMVSIKMGHHLSLFIKPGWTNKLVVPMITPVHLAQWDFYGIGNTPVHQIRHPSE